MARTLRAIGAAPELEYLRQQPDFERFAQNGYKCVVETNQDTTLSRLERLAQLKEKEVLTAEEFQEQKKRILAGGRS